MQRICQQAKKFYFRGMMTTLELELSKRQGSGRAAHLASLCRRGKFEVRELINLCFHRDPVLAFHAAWVLEHVFLTPGAANVDWAYFFERYGLQTNPSCQRHFTKIAIHFFTKVCSDIDVDVTAVIERTMEWLAAEQTPVAVKANCIDILYALRAREDWLREELTFQIEFILRHSTSAALQSRGKKFLAKLSKEKKL